MTFVLSALTQKQVIQVSDRRFTYFRADGSVLKRDDEKNKAVLFCGRMIFAFTGLGALGVERQTDLWLANRICDVIRERPGGDQGTLARGLAEKTTELFRKPRYRGQRHAFVGVGWAHFHTGPTPESDSPEAGRPYLVLISNFIAPDGRELSAARADFAVWLRVLRQDEAGYVRGVPAHLSAAEGETLIGRLAGARSPERMVDVMGEQIRKVAERDEGVGEGLMVSALPRAVRGRPPGIDVVVGGPIAEEQVFLYVPPSGNTTTQLGPVATCGDGVISEYRLEPSSAE